MTDVLDCAFYLISRASLALAQTLKRELAAADVGQVRPAYLGVIMSLWQEDGLKGVELCRRASLEASTMTGLLDRMERDGLVSRSADPDDRRAQRIHLTDQGRRVRKTVEAVVTRTIDEVTAGVPVEELEQLKGTLRQLLSNTHRLGAK